jgi:probable rRNA maturation factor
VSGRGTPLSPAAVRRIVKAVLLGERQAAVISITFLGRNAMRRLNAEHRGHDRATDVLAFALPQPGLPLGDVYICPWVAARQAEAHGVSVREELVRLIVHGTLHALGRGHPEGTGRTRSAMWRRQERYVEALA